MRSITAAGDRRSCGYRGSLPSMDPGGGRFVAIGGMRSEARRSAGCVAGGSVAVAIA